MAAYTMRTVRTLSLLSGLVFAGAGAVQAQGLTYHLGRAPTEQEISAWDFAISPAGTELPEGSGSAQQGAQLFAMKCAMCHGPTGADGVAPALVGKNTVPMTWPHATSVWDYIYRAMPLYQEGSLKFDEAYALTAFLLNKNNIIKETDVLNRKNLADVKMPNRDGYVLPPEWTPGKPRAFKIVNP